MSAQTTRKRGFPDPTPPIIDSKGFTTEQGVHHSVRTEGDGQIHLHWHQYAQGHASVSSFESLTVAEARELALGLEQVAQAAENAQGTISQAAVSG